MKKIKKKFLLDQLPQCTMYYISPKRNSEATHTFYLNIKGINWIVELVNKNLAKPSAIRERRKMTEAMRLSIIKRDNYTCAICGNSIYKEPNLLMEVDHIIPISLGGKTEPNNLQTLCWRCNRTKRDHVLIENHESQDLKLPETVEWE